MLFTTLASLTSLLISGTIDRAKAHITILPDPPYRHNVRMNLLASDCRLVLGQKEYNLCPLLDYKHTVLRDDGNGVNGSSLVYTVALAGTVEQDGQCPPGTRICLDDPSNRAKLSTAPALSSTPGDLTIIIDARLELLLVNNFYHDGRPSTAHINLLCDHDIAEKPSTLKFIEVSSDDIHMFSWTTEYACGQRVSSLTESAQLLSEGNDSPDSNSTNKDEDGQERDLLHTKPFPGSRRSVATTLLLTAGLISIVGLLIYSPPAPVTKFVNLYIRPLQFRVGEQRLIRWLQEDSVGLENLDADEEDVMVNAIPIDAVDVEAGQYIPLKPSPRKNFVKNYGSAIMR